MGTPGGILRRTTFGLIALAACCPIPLAAQPSPNPHSALHQLLHPDGHARPLPADAPRTPEVVLDATSLGSPLLLDKGWRVGITSNPEAANPGFDDSAWATRDATSNFAEVPDQDHPAGAPEWKEDQPHSPGHQRPFAWFRIHLNLAPNHGPVALLVLLPVSTNTNVNIGSQTLGVDLFANGRLIHPEGPHATDPERFQQISRIYNIDIPPSETSLTLVIRTIFVRDGLDSYTSFFAHRTLRIGHPAYLDKELELWTHRTLFERLPRLVNAILLTVLAMFLLALFFSQKGHKEYLLLALFELLQAPIGFVDLAGSFARIDRAFYAVVLAQLVALSAYLYFEFLIAFLSLRKRWYISTLRYTAPILLGAGTIPMLLLSGAAKDTAAIVLLVLFLIIPIWIVAWFLFVFITLIAATVRRNFEAGLLLFPFVLSLVGMIEPMLTGGMTDVNGHPYISPLTIQAGPIPIHFASIADFTGIFVIVLIIFVRFLRVQRDQQRASSELAAARSVQELIIPREKIQTPGFEVESIYNPANEVGGDFYHLQPTPDGGLLVVIGDVAGKGLRAAMNVSMIMGALRRNPERSPARILESLNRVLVGYDSFTTCQAAFFGANGEMVLANAGHLPPYLNSQEISIRGSLPLGVVPDATYDEVRLYLHQGDRILLLSDGVVEARRPNGELFGFNRVHNLSSQSAFYIADAAKEFGQEDDITVLTIKRLAQAIAA